MVVPLMGTWIEIPNINVVNGFTVVVPLMGTWIEISSDTIIAEACKSSPSWGRGLKFKLKCVDRLDL